ncbi:MAG: hypothetical protein ABGZ35_15095 [Planctomycetaceae bacterium]
MLPEISGTTGDIADFTLSHGIGRRYGDSAPLSLPQFCHRFISRPVLYSYLMTLT